MHGPPLPVPVPSAPFQQAEEEYARFSRESTSAKEQAALALSEVEGAAQVAAWEVRSLREELKRARERSEELSSAAEEARESVSASVRTELEGLREAVRVAEAAKEKAEDGLARMKDKRKRDLQVSLMVRVLVVLFCSCWHTQGRLPSFVCIT